ncbi:MAG: response regulator [Synechococcales bacterium]|nr:response regulator [Synechococcales bacterium]
MRILLVDDDEALMDGLAAELIRQQYAVDIATDGEMAWEFLQLFSYDLLVLDVELPKRNGIELCRMLRMEGHDMPILVLTARDNVSDRVKGLDAGADDYVIKPVNFQELTARIRALLRRDSHALPPILQWEQLCLDPNTREVTYGDRPLHLTPKEYALLELFLRHSSHVFTLDAIIDGLWAFDDPPSKDAVRTHMKGLRQKFKQAGAPKDLIETVYGVGYRLKPLENWTAPPAKAASPADLPPVTIPPTPAPAVAPEAQPQTAVAIAQTWNRYLDVMSERIAVLEEAAAAIQEAGCLDQALQQSALSSAHKLAGSLGSFGYVEGSALARQIETCLQPPLSWSAQRIQAFCDQVVALRQQIGRPVETIAFRGHPRLLLITPDAQLAHQLTIAAYGSGLEMAIASTPDQIRSNTEQTIPAGDPPPDVILLTIDGQSDGAAPVLNLLTELREKLPQTPILVLTERADLQKRLEVVRRGARMVIQQPILPNQVMKAIAQLLQATGRGSRILVVDDDDAFLAVLKTLLLPWGFQLTTLSNLEEFWQVLEATRPNLLMLDIDMPSISGLELCQVLRADPEWVQLPILFLTGHHETAMKHSAFSVGADDFITKPITINDLAERILNRLERTYVMQH